MGVHTSGRIAMSSVMLVLPLFDDLLGDRDLTHEHVAAWGLAGPAVEFFEGILSLMDQVDGFDSRLVVAVQTLHPLRTGIMPGPEATGPDVERFRSVLRRGRPVLIPESKLPDQTRPLLWTSCRCSVFSQSVQWAIYVPEPTPTTLYSPNFERAYLLAMCVLNAEDVDRRTYWFTELARHSAEHALNLLKIAPKLRVALADELNRDAFLPLLEHAQPWIREQAILMLGAISGGPGRPRKAS